MSGNGHPAGISPALWRAYHATTYRVIAPDGEIDIAVGRNSEALDRLLDSVGGSSWAFVSAANPGSVALTNDENDERHATLLSELAARELRAIEGVGLPNDEHWIPERSVWVVDLEPDPARELGRRFGQNAIVVGQRGGPAMLLACEPSAP